MEYLPLVFLPRGVGGDAIPTITLPDGTTYRAIDADFDIVKTSHATIETEQGVRIRFQTTLTKVLVAVDEHGQVLKSATGEPIVQVQSGNIVRAEITDTPI